MDSTQQFPRIPLYSFVLRIIHIPQYFHCELFGVLRFPTANYSYFLLLTSLTVCLTYIFSKLTLCVQFVFLTIPTVNFTYIFSKLTLCVQFVFLTIPMFVFFSSLMFLWCTVWYTKGYY